MNGGIINRRFIIDASPSNPSDECIWGHSPVFQLVEPLTVVLSQWYWLSQWVLGLTLAICSEVDYHRSAVRSMQKHLCWPNVDALWRKCSYGSWLELRTFCIPRYIQIWLTPPIGLPAACGYCPPINLVFAGLFWRIWKSRRTPPNESAFCGWIDGLLFKSNGFNRELNNKMDEAVCLNERVFAALEEKNINMLFGHLLQLASGESKKSKRIEC